MDLRHITESNVGKEFGARQGKSGPHKSEFAYITRIGTLTKYTKMIGYNIVGDYRRPLSVASLSFES